MFYTNIEYTKSYIYVFLFIGEEDQMERVSQWGRNRPAHLVLRYAFPDF